ncbi:hypothetical protein KFV02_07385 [Desulfohalobiaceae bacterium Ax17]|jgi:hypothetical protein|uniref:hypothetical protein n=1 Tax=Desulfovulcanus ferrireducens TaxID=2831190 RepID=UPI00207BCD9D|nr:hypothetical protein [Desulfovulcanus ferrireducens]MBT8763753.1 hypothetical protein [Desulfovulcanus ferrireducens]
MGRVLQIRVMAYTFSEKEVEEAWPGLYKIAFGQEKLSGIARVRGVLELVDTLHDRVRFEDLDKKMIDTLSPRLNKILSIKKQLEEALADWQPQIANKLSYSLEDELDQLEKEIRQL